MTTNELIRIEYDRIIKLNKFDLVQDYINSKGFNPLSIELSNNELEDLLLFCKSIS